MLDLILYYHEKINEAMRNGIAYHNFDILDVDEEIARVKYISEDAIDEITSLKSKIDSEIELRSTQEV
jgi:V/A-type H+-transporting ATPase subunit A